jgi:hypothetical protein
MPSSPLSVAQAAQAPAFEALVVSEHDAVCARMAALDLGRRGTTPCSKTADRSTLTFWQAI